MEQNNQIKHKNKGLTLIVVLLLTITIIASSIGLWAWAKYTSAQNGNATAQIAKWSFDLRLKEGKQNATETSGPIDLASTQFNHVANDRIAPGTSGLFYVIVDTTGTEVDVLYNVNITLTKCPRNIKFYRGTDATTGEELSLGGVNSTSRSFSFSRYLQAKGTNGNENRKYEEPIYWVWDYSGSIEGNATIYDQWDTADSNLGTTTMTITATGTEMLSKPLSFGTLKNGQTVISNGSTINLGVGDTTTLSVTGAENVTYSSSDSSKVTVNSTTGAVEAVAAGSAVITVTGVSSGETMTVNITITAPVFNPQNITIGTAINTNKYGWKVNGYTAGGINTWRLFYEDNNYAYIISDTAISTIDYPYQYMVNENQRYSTVSTVGLRLNSLTASYLNDNVQSSYEAYNNEFSDIQGVAWLTDTENSLWTIYKNNNALYSIGSPTYELFCASYNSVHGDSPIDLTLGEENKYLGYNELIDSNYGIYTAQSDESYWLASSHNSGWAMCCVVNSSIYGDWIDETNLCVRPVVCMHKSVFENNYNLLDE